MLCLVRDTIWTSDILVESHYSGHGRLLWYQIRVSEFLEFLSMFRNRCSYRARQLRNGHNSFVIQTMRLY
jgi:hypothetical protein